MINKECKQFMTSEEHLQKILSDLKKWHIEPEENADNFKFSVQAYNTVYTIHVIILDRMPQDDRASWLGSHIPFVKSFEDIQLKIFTKVIWNWR